MGFWNWNLIKICVRTYFGYELNSQVRCAFGNVQTIKCPFLWCRRIQIQIPKNQICTVLLQSFRSSLSDYGRQCFDPERLLVWKSDFDLLQKVSWKWKVNFEFRKNCCAANLKWCRGLESQYMLKVNFTTKCVHFPISHQNYIL